MNTKQGNKKSIVIFIHGIKGSVLVDKKGSPVWLTGAQGLGLDTPNLSLPLNWQGETQEKDSIYAKEVLSEVKVIPFILEEKVYSPWLKAGRNLFGENFYPFAYDWRRDNLENVVSFEQFIEKLRSQNPEANVTVVAHSMGGLITMALLNKRPEFFTKVIFVGVPFYGGIGFMEDLHVGTPSGLNRKILSGEVLFSMPSVYTLFPLETMERVVVEDNSGNPIEVNFYSPEDWRKHKFGVFANNSDPNLEKKFQFLTSALKNAKQFKGQIKATNIKYPPILVVTGKTHPTLSKIQKNGKQSVNGWDFQSLPREMGDGRVLEKNSFPPKGILYETFYSSWEHSSLLNDPAVIDRIKGFIELK
ncbi:MAG: alpha/beta fold hydrolase [Leptospiraceae bacterium]|nr:alpha/beta fold hydrolase [Leptospiraceae bacterium]